MIDNSSITSKRRIKERVITPTGERLKKFRFWKGHKRKSTFAREINSSHATVSAIEDNGREISGGFMDLLTEKYKDFNPDWLRSGQGSMLRSEYVSDGKFSLVKEEGLKSYQQGCEECVKKEKEIIKLKADMSDMKDEIIRLLKEASAIKKASSG